MAHEIPIDSITVQKFLGSGSYGHVYSAVLNGKVVAVKKLTPQAHQKNHKREVDHIEELKKLQHRNIIRFIGITVEDSCYGIVMEYCPNGSLNDVLHGGEAASQVTFSKKMDWAVQIARGMNYLHTRNPPVIHRDLKPPNILVAGDGVLKITDFGEHRLWPTLKSTKFTACGTPSYMAPEQIKNETCSWKVDVWSYGVVLWELYTGQIPYHSVESCAVYFGVGNNTLHLDVPDSTPEALKDLLRQCWLRHNERPSLTDVLLRRTRERPSFKDILRNLSKIFIYIKIYIKIKLYINKN